MDKLWAPWRIGYIEAKAKKGCIFCNAKKTKGKNFVFLRSKFSLAMLNSYPYNNGHILVAPLRHVNDISALDRNELIDVFLTLRQTKDILSKVLKPHGFNIGINIFADAGAGITGHLHIHIVPRYRGDTNFMPAIYNTKVISQSLDDLFQKLTHADTKRNQKIRR